MVMSAINLLEDRLDTSDIMKKALVLEPQKAVDALERWASNHSSKCMANLRLSHYWMNACLIWTKVMP